MTGPTPTPQQILVSPETAALTALTGVPGGVRYDVSLAGVRERADLCERFVADLGLPYPCGGLDGLVDWLADLDWLDHGSGVTLVVDATGAEPEPVLALCELAPAIVDRWRSAGEPFVLALTGLASDTAVIEALERGNARLAEHAALPWALPGTGPVPVVGGSADLG